MQSSTTVACRALVMLLCLIVIPLGALFGTRLPELAKRLLERDWDLSALRLVWDRESLPEAPSFGSTAHGAPWSARPDDRTSRGPTSPFQAASACPSGTPGTACSTTHGPACPITSQPLAGADIRGPGSPRPASSLPRTEAVALWGSSDSAAGPARSSLAALRRPDVGLASAPTAEHSRLAGPKGGNVTPPQTLPSSDRFAQMQRRLRELGSTYYLLETWGTDGQLYRFHSRIAIGGNPKYTRHFEATDSDALRAMARVLGQVEAWRASAQTL